jgi:hypothetical protein
MKETFLTQFSNKATKAHKKGADCYKAQDYMGFLVGHFEEGYYRTLAYAVSGQNLENGQCVIDSFQSSFKVEKQGTSRLTQALKKMGKLDKIPEIEAAIKRLSTDVSEDFLALANKSTQIYHTLMNMSTWEKVEKGLTHNVNNEFDAEDQLFIEDKVIMGIINRRKTKGYFDLFIKEIQRILQ